MTMAEFFMMRPHGPNCWMGLGALSDRVRLQIHHIQRERQTDRQR